MMCENKKEPTLIQNVSNSIVEECTNLCRLKGNFLERHNLKGELCET